jgi:hypothetical protein
MTGVAENGLFRCLVKIRPGPGCDLPPHLIGAFVECFAAAPDPMAALRLLVERLSGRGFVFEDLLDGQVHQHDPHKWDEYVSSVWPELVGHFPPQAEVLRLVQTSGVFFGPFRGWESDAAPDVAADRPRE